jgi:hypothetical protein
MTEHKLNNSASRSEKRDLLRQDRAQHSLSTMRDHAKLHLDTPRGRFSTQPVTEIPRQSNYWANADTATLPPLGMTTPNNGETAFAPPSPSIPTAKAGDGPIEKPTGEISSASVGPTTDSSHPPVGGPGGSAATGLSITRSDAAPPILSADVDEKLNAAIGRGLVRRI